MAIIRQHTPSYINRNLYFDTLATCNYFMVRINTIALDKSRWIACTIKTSGRPGGRVDVGISLHSLVLIALLDKIGVQPSAQTHCGVHSHSRPELIGLKPSTSYHLFLSNEIARFLATMDQSVLKHRAPTYRGSSSSSWWSVRLWQRLCTNSIRITIQSIYC